jgi:hypothetical protein
MNPGSVFFDEEFAFHDGETGEKLFVVLGSSGKSAVVAKTTSQQHGRGTTFGCQPKDRFHNFFLPPRSCYFRTSTWICLDEFYEVELAKALQKRFQGTIKPLCTLDQHLRAIQECALASDDITDAQRATILACLAAPATTN